VLLFFDPGDLRTSLEATGLKVVLFDSPASIRGVYEQIDLLGQISGHVEEAANLVASMQAGIEGIVESLGDRAGPTVFHEGDNTFFSAGPGSFVGDLYDTLRAENIANATGEPFPQLTQEAIIAAAPEVIILADEDAGETAETVKARPGWDSIPAVQNGRIYTIDPNIISRPGPRLVEALETLAGFLYRES